MHLLPASRGIADMLVKLGLGLYQACMAAMAAGCQNVCGKWSACTQHRNFRHASYI
jgi:hypothetical protein